jgi:hypothetical protein
MLDENARPFEFLKWSAIATGAVIALAVQTVLVAFGLGIATSVGDHVPGGGFVVWVVLVELVALAIGAALTARLSHAESRRAGVAAGIMTWAVVLLVGGFVMKVAMSAGFAALGAWAFFFGDVFSLGAAIAGGIYGSTLRASAVEPRTYDEKHVPVH